MLLIEVSLFVKLLLWEFSDDISLDNVENSCKEKVGCCCVAD